MLAEELIPIDISYSALLRCGRSDVSQLNEHNQLPALLRRSWPLRSP